MSHRNHGNDSLGVYLAHTFKALRQNITPDATRKFVDFSLPSLPMVEACRADEFDFFQPFIAAGHLTVEQMRHASQRYLLGKTKSGQPIFWMIDDMCSPLDAHIGNGWISQMLKAREPLIASRQVQHCLFGLHLLGHTEITEITETICVVEAEKTAVVLSELFPESIWMAYVTTAHLCPELFAPLQGCTVIVYPRTDPTLSTYLFFEDLAMQICRCYDLDISVDSTLEEHATNEQKEQCVDLVDFLFSTADFTD